SSLTKTGHPGGTDAVYQVNRAGRASALVRSSVLGHPTGVALVGGVVWICTQGSGKLYGLKRSGKLITGPPLADGRLSGLKAIGKDDVIVTSWAGDAIYRGSLTGSFEYLQGGVSLPGHPGWDAGRRRLLVPSQGPGTVHVYVLEPRPPKKKRRR
ncbi:MAG: hypothetical protein QF464_17405, partial [Myxococcota bacterium]|nr:hypothetical protein [Myxococcota bacterium]